jgi:hypothetical protein
VLTSAKTCKDCTDHACSIALLEDVEAMAKEFADSKALEIDPTPELTLRSFERRTHALKQSIENTTINSNRVKNLLGAVDLQRPQADLLLLESGKQARSASAQVKEASDMLVEGKKLQEKAKDLTKDVEGNQDNYVRTQFNSPVLMLSWTRFQMYCAACKIMASATLLL